MAFYDVAEILRRAGICRKFEDVAEYRIDYQNGILWIRFRNELYPVGIDLSTYEIIHYEVDC